MYCKSRRISAAILLWALVLGVAVCVQAQNDLNSAHPRPAVSILDSTKDQDGLVGAVRRVKTETAKIEFKEGRQTEGPLALVELTTYGIKGNRVENTSYPISGSLIGKEEYKYDDKGNIVEMTLRDSKGTILSKEAYDYEFDKIGNWTKMVTNLVVFQNGEVKHEPVEVTYRTLTYYYDDSVAKIVDNPEPKLMNARLPEATFVQTADVDQPQLGDLPKDRSAAAVSVAGDPPPLIVKTKAPVIAQVTDKQVAGLSTEANTPAKTSNKFRERTETAAPVVSVPRETDSAARAKVTRGVTRENSVTTTTVIPASTKVSAPAAPAGPTAAEFYQVGRDRFDAGDNKGAVNAFLESVKLDPNSAEVLLNLGLAYLRLQKDKDSAKAFKESVRLNPDQPEAQYGLGLANFRMGRFRDAADAFKKAIKLTPNMAKSHFALGLSYQELGESNAVLQEIRILESLDRNLARKLSEGVPQIDVSCSYKKSCH